MEHTWFCFSFSPLSLLASRFLPFSPRCSTPGEDLKTLWIQHSLFVIDSTTILLDWSIKYK